MSHFTNIGSLSAFSVVQQLTSGNRFLHLYSLGAIDSDLRPGHSLSKPIIAEGVHQSIFRTN